VGWGNRSRKRLHRVIAEANRYVQILNDSFTDPSGEQAQAERPAAAPLTVVESVAREEKTVM